ncbi:MAG: AsmA family protein [Desulfobacterales bacterium]|nr:AsmA family protein [Desulfobacterales bacterium]
MSWKWFLSLTIVLIVALILIATGYAILASYDYNKLKPKIAQAVKDATGRELTLGGDIELEIGFTPTLVVEDVSFQNAPWAWPDEMAKIRRFEIQAALLPLILEIIDVKRLILVEPEILIVTDYSGKSNLQFEAAKDVEPVESKKEATAKGEMVLPTMTFNEVRIVGGRLTYKDARLGRAYVVTLDRLAARTSDMNSPVELELKGAYNNKPFAVAGTIGPLIALGDPCEEWSLNLTARTGGSSVIADGAIRDVMNAKGLDLTVTVEVWSIADIAGLADVTGMPDVGPFRVAARLFDPDAKTYKISDIKVTLGDGGIAGSAEIGLAGKRPRLTAALSSQMLDLRPSPSIDEETDEPAEKQEKVFSDDPLPLDALKQTDVNLKIRTGKVLLPFMAIEELDADLILEDGTITVKPHKFVVGGGGLDGHFSLHPEGKEAVLSMSLEVDQADLGRMLKELGAKEVIEGKLDAEIDLYGRGGSVAALMAGLNGKAVVVMGDGRIDNKYIRLLGTDLSSGIFRMLNPFKRETNYADLNCFVVGFNIKEGLAESSALVLDTSLLTVVGDGKADLKTEKLGMSLKPSPKKGIGIQGVGKLSLSLSELAKPLKLSGTFADPTLSIDKTRTIITLGKAVGGVALFGPAGIAAALAGGSLGGKKDTCLSAIEAAKKGSKVSGGKKTKEKNGKVKDAGNRHKNLLGK